MPDGKYLGQKALREMARSWLRRLKELILLGIVLVEHPWPARQLTIVEPIWTPVLRGFDQFPGKV